MLCHGVPLPSYNEVSRFIPMASAGRPSVITAEMAKVIEAYRPLGLNVAQLHRRLEEQGLKMSLRTLHRYLAGSAPAPGAGENLMWAQHAADPAGDLPIGADVDPDGVPDADDERFTPERLLGDIRQRYLQALGIANNLKGPASLGGPEARKWAEMVRIQGELAERLSRMAPPPIPSPDDDPAYIEAKQRLLERATEIAAGLPKPQ